MDTLPASQHPNRADENRQFDLREQKVDPKILANLEAFLTNEAAYRARADALNAVENPYDEDFDEDYAGGPRQSLEISEPAMTAVANAVTFALQYRSTCGKYSLAGQMLDRMGVTDPKQQDRLFHSVLRIAAAIREV